MEDALLWIYEITFWVSGMMFFYAMEHRDYFLQRLAGWIVIMILFLVGANSFLIEVSTIRRGFLWIAGYGLLMLFGRSCWNISWSVSMYQAIWAFVSWQLIAETWIGLLQFWGVSIQKGNVYTLGGMLLFFLFGFVVLAFTIVRWMPEGGPKKIGPKQLLSALLIFGTFEIIALVPANVPGKSRNGEALYLSQILLAVILYLQNELFKKSAMRQELAVMNLLWKKEQEQYQLSRENIALINQKCHDLKHQIRAIRNLNKEELDQYLEEMEGTIRIYESIVKTGNEALDTILTEKSLYCKDKGILVSCVADGSQMEFINTVDLYAILGNALDNAIEAVEKFKHTEKRQIDVLIYRQQNFLVMNIINPIKGNLVYEEDLPVSTKGDKRFHGYGLRSMRYLVKKYDGFLNISEEDGCFSLKILIPIPKYNK